MKRLKAENSATSFQFGEPLQVLFRAAAIMFLSVLVGLFFPGLTAFLTGVFYDSDVVAKMAQNQTMQGQYLKLQTYEEERRALRSAITSLDMQIASTASNAQTAETVKSDLSIFRLRRDLESQLRALKPPIVASGFFLGSTMLLWPIAFT